MNDRSWTTRPITRRRLLIAGGASAGLVALSGCSWLDTDPAGSGDGPSDAPGTDLRESPQLAARVEAGELPPLSERLPANPSIVEPVDRAGVYGGTWTSALLGPEDEAWLQRTVGYDPLMRWNPEWSEPVPNIAESVEQSDDGHEFLITLRAGMKWSDGAPFTADDLVFAFQDFLLNKELSPAVPSFLTNGGQPATLTRVDDQSVRFTFAEPNGLFLEQLALINSGDVLVSLPAHYLQQFHATYTEGADAVAASAGFASWTELMLARSETYQNAEKPTLNAWMLTNALGDATTVTAERNPYYWKTDPDGRQLPYLDSLSFEVVSDAEVILLKATNGEFAFHTRHVTSLANKPVLAEGREEGGYEFMTLRSSLMNEMVIFLNLTHQDPVKRAVFGNKDFRIGLSHAIDRAELNTATFQDEGEPWQAAPAPDSRYYDEELATQYLEFDVDLANEALDRAGLTQRDGSGFRLAPDGSPLSIEVEVAEPGVVPYWLDAMNLVVGYWNEVGINARTRPEDRTLFKERTEANQHDAGVWVGPGGLGDETRRPFFYLPTMRFEQAFAPAWAQWYQSNGAQGEEPPEPTRRQCELFWELARTPDPDQREELFGQILEIARDQFYVIGTLRVPTGYGIVRDDFHNVPEEMPESFDFATPGGSSPCQYFIE
ncbi:ABC transporter substrate-binding protein [Jiangella sp. DSM 45060]|uniref:ABC transporter substrate-binding protein n=1 Tax=Jiangella sp. DSM 45060 TaxID=1798224 RepID=UPI000879C8A9|nr:ABC transporter substrate-binding protein [Jiangella sp. DSM 45060]SDS58648.1 peptide/nickel transport system substrate-binding protein [Jiangella sp. DSM 45060]